MNIFLVFVFAGSELTFQNRVHGATVHCAAHVHEEQLLRTGWTLGQIEDDELLMGGQRFDDFVKRFAFDFRADDIDLCPMV